MKQAATPSAAERVLDGAIELTFPASDPISVEHAFFSAGKRDQPVTQGESRQTRRAKPKRQTPR
jgi:hypothetical protein